jgi:hypothetical protein
MSYSQQLLQLLKCFSNSNISSFNGNSSTLDCCSVFTSTNKVRFQIQPFEFGAGPYMEESLHVLVVGELSLFKRLFVIFDTCVYPLNWWWIHESQFPNVSFLVK